MTDLLYTDYRADKFENLINLRITTPMLEHIKYGAEIREMSISEFIRYLLFIGLKSVEER